jgi:2-oxoglutarate ferredoxin oxidoreductase subunit beta
MIERAMKHDGFSVVEVHTHCANFYDDAFDCFNSRKGGKFDTIDETKHDVTDLNAAFRLASLETPGVFGVFYEAKGEPARTPARPASWSASRPTSNDRRPRLLQSAFNR